MDADQIPDRQKRKLFGYVEQSFPVIPGTIADQITLKSPDISAEQIEKALKTAGLWESVNALEKGWDTPYKPGLFSQGQLQLLSIARAVAAEPAILLLDEITANLDSVTEKKVLAALQEASKRRTVISISHRLYQQAGGRKMCIRDREKADFLQILELLYLRSKTESRNGFPHVTKRLKDEGGRAEHPGPETLSGGEED